MEVGIDYELEEVLPLVIRLTEQYTSKDSSSVPYEAANMLMGAVLYSIQEAYQENNSALRGAEKASAQILYERGTVLVLGKTFEAKNVYEEIIADFEDYGVWNYRDTILTEIPKFFVSYDPKYNPQEHGVDLSYPLFAGQPAGSGADLVLEYLKGIRREKAMLDHLDRGKVIERLDEVSDHNRRDFIGNIYAAL